MKIVIMGIGKMGTWLAKALASDHELAAYDPAAAPEQGGARLLLELEGIREFAPDMLVNCVPLGSTVQAFDSVLAYLPEPCILSDIASVKTGLADFYARSKRPFVSTHPMFGPTYADDENLHDQNAIVIEESCEQGKNFWRHFYEGLGIHVFEDGFDGHDKTVAYSLATPFASSMVFSACMKNLDAPGTNFRKHLDIARGLLAEDDMLLAEIMFNPHTTRQLELINSQLSYLTHIINGRDYEEMGLFLQKLRSNIGEPVSMSR